MSGNVFVMEQKVMDLWALFAPMLPREQQRIGGVGRPRADVKRVFEAVVWVLKTGVQWRFIPKGYFPAYQTCHRYYQSWVAQGLFKRLIRKVRRVYGKDAAGHLRQMHYVDGTFVPAKKGEQKWVKQSAARVQK